MFEHIEGGQFVSVMSLGFELMQDVDQGNTFRPGLKYPVNKGEQVSKFYAKAQLWFIV